MDRRKALEQLEVIRPGTDDMSDSELAEAVAAVNADPIARQELERRIRRDARISEVMRDVDVPGDLRDKLYAAAGVGESVEPIVSANEPAPRKAVDTPAIRGRRVSRRAVVGAMSLTIAAIAAFIFWPDQLTVSYLTIRDQAPRDAAAVVSAATASSRNAASMPDLKLPLPIERMQGVSRIGWKAAGSDVSSLVLARANWVLVVTPVDQVTGLPEVRAGGTVGGSRNGYSHGMWIDEDFVYVLFVKGQKRDLDNVWRREFRGAAA